ncbi:hypothetical protein Rs2_40927 [Raphanus sativus]|nr:hypothetical protein Rs2_40927 [Raphanus sativus]
MTLSRRNRSVSDHRRPFHGGGRVIEAVASCFRENCIEEAKIVQEGDDPLLTSKDDLVYLACCTRPQSVGPPSLAFPEEKETYAKMAAANFKIPSPNRGYDANSIYIGQDVWDGLKVYLVTPHSVRVAASCSAAHMTRDPEGHLLMVHI